MRAFWLLLLGLILLAWSVFGPSPTPTIAPAVHNITPIDHPSTGWLDGTMATPPVKTNFSAALRQALQCKQ